MILCFDISILEMKRMANGEWLIGGSGMMRTSRDFFWHPTCSLYFSGCAVTENSRTYDDLNLTTFSSSTNDDDHDSLRR